MPTIDPSLLPISNPIPVPGTRLRPTRPSLAGPPAFSSLILVQGPSNIEQGTLRRFPSIGNTKKLSLENLTLRTKIAELERYLTGLKEELILAHRQIHSKNLEAKISQERKTVEIHELGQHIQRCEFDLLAKTAECEALQNRLMHQTKEQVSKLKHIHLLENEIMDYKRMSVMSGGAASTTSTKTGPNSRIMSCHSRNSTDMTSNTDAAIIRQLKEENAHKDDQIKDLNDRIRKLELALGLALGLKPGDTLSEESHSPHVEHSKDSPVKPALSVDLKDAKALHELASGKVAPLEGAETSRTVNSVGYDVVFEHPKLLARYQALRMSHAQAAEYVDTLETENKDLKEQLFEMAASTSNQCPRSSPTLTKTDVVDPLAKLTPLDTDTVLVHYDVDMDIDKDVSEQDVDENEGKEMKVDDVKENAEDHNSTTSPTLSNDSTSPPTSPNSPTSSPTLPNALTCSSISTSAPALTRKSSLRYTRDGRMSPTPSQSS
ncbi:hypothetical protein BGZ94_002924 [Podila epigama]|nr:hypothetical protein BGZ94_002924 [Podila epigama]